MKGLRQDALKHWASGLARWQPRRLVLFAPLCISNLLPCELNIALHFAEEGSTPEEDKSRSHLTSLKLAKGEQQRVHVTSMDTRLMTRLWVDGSSFETSKLHGSFSFQAPASGTHQSMWCSLFPPSEMSSSLAVVLRLELNSAVNGSCTLSIGTTHWLHNASSLALRLYDARDTVNHVLHSDPKSSGNAQLFSLDTRFKRSLPPNRAMERIGDNVAYSKARIGLAPSTPESQLEERAEFLSQAFSIEAVGTDGTLEVRYRDGSVAELAVEISQPAQRNTIAGCTTITLHDRFVLRNRTGYDLEWAQPGVYEANTLKTSSLADGKDVPICWGPGSGRKLQVRTKGATHAWCAGFSPEVLGKVILKLWPNVEASTSSSTHVSEYDAAIAAGKSVEDAISRDAEVLYFRLVISTNGSQHIMSLLPISQESLRQLPYRICNGSELLIAFRQHGSTHWDLLGGGETCEYIWDDPRATRALQVHACDATGTSMANSLPAAYHLDRVERCPELKLDPRHSDITSAFASPKDAVLLTVACTLRYGISATARAIGWLCLTSSQLLFISFAPGAAASATHMQLSSALLQLGVSATTSRFASRRSLNRSSLSHAIDEEHDEADRASQSNLYALHKMPLALEQIADVVNGKYQGELLLRTAWGALCILRGLRNRDNTRERIDAAHHSLRANRYRNQAKLKDLMSQISKVDKRLSERGVSGDHENGAAMWPKAGKRISIAEVKESKKKQEVGAALIVALARGKFARNQVQKKRQMTEAASGNRGVFARPDHAPLLVPRQPHSRLMPELNEAILAGSIRRAQILLQQRADPETADARGHTALMNACAHSSVEFVSLLLEANADVEAETKNGSRALHVASRVDARACASKLLEAGADPSARRGDGKKPAALAQPRSRLLRTLKEAESKWVQRDRPVLRPVLVHAVAVGDAERVLALLSARTDPNSIDEHGTAAIHAACACANFKITELLLHAAANPNLAVADRLAARPLHCAAFAGSQACVQSLLLAKGDPMLRDATLRLPIERCPQNDSAARQLLLRVMGNDPPKTTKPGHRRAASDGKVNTTSKEPTKLYATIALHGPVREMRLSDRTEGQHDSWGPNRLLSTDKVAAKESGELICELQLEGIGLSLIDQEPREILHVSLQQLNINAVRSSQQHSLKLSLFHLQETNYFA